MCAVIFIKSYITYDTMLPGMTIHRIDRLSDDSYHAITGVVEIEEGEKYFVNSYTGDHTLITIRDIYNGRYLLI